ncbi:MAG: hypothetical protein K2L63_01450 [Paramuribaculum sp.]|nr:hypothetical protein [Paramuribaculum sp.]
MTTDYNDIRALLGLTFEIEGLLMLTERRAEMTPAEVSQMLIDKCARLMDGVNSLTAAAEAAVASAAPEDPVAPAMVSQAECAEEDNAGVDNEIAEAVVYEETADADIEPQPEDEIIMEVVEEEEPVPAPVAETEPTPVVEHEPIVAPIAPAPAPVKQAKTITLTLNDRFRFRRTLFGGSDAMMNETVTALSAITNPDDITDFITNDLCWNMDDPEVADFLAIVEAAR